MTQQTESATLKRIREWAESSSAYLSNREGYPRGYREGIMKAKSIVLELLDETDTYEEVRTDYYDEERKAFAVDAYTNLDESDDDAGHTVAWIHDDGTVEWIDESAKSSGLVTETIETKLNELKKS